MAASLRASLAFGITLAIALVAGERLASANPGINNYSGKPDAFNPGTTCDSTCHAQNNPIPTLDITMPESVAAGSTNQVTIVVNGTRARTSINAAFSDGVKAVKGQNTDVPFPAEAPGELVAVVPPPAGKSGTYKFSFVAPSTNGTIKLWVAAMSASGSGNGNDGVAKTVRAITVTGGGAPADGGVTPPNDGGATSDGGAVGRDAGATGDPDDGNDDGDDGNSSPKRPGGGDEAGGCTASPHSARHGEGLFGLVAIAVTGLGCRRRRHRK